TSFPAGDCRTAAIPSSTTVTDAQVAGLITEFDINMYPKETSTFSTPPDRDGSNSAIPPDANGNGGVYTGDGDKTVTLVDNVRDDNYYTFPAAPTYIAGFFSSQINELLDRNVMTIDAYDWLHLLHYYTDPFEGNWINEGLSDYAQTLTGYVDASATVYERGADSHI